MKLLHLYSPPLPHADAFVIGTPAGLRALRDAIDRALVNQYAMVEEMCNDGEHYEVFVVGVVNDAIEKNLALPYTAPFTEDVGESTISPHETIGNKKYMELLKKQVKNG